MELSSVTSDPFVHTRLDAGKPRPTRPGTLHVVAWTDPVIDRSCVDPRSHYVETFWLAVLGPSATWLLRRLADRFDVEPEGFTVDPDELARSLGLGDSGSRHSPLQRAIERCVHYGVASRPGGGRLAVRTRVPLIPRRQLLRLATELRDHHRAWEVAEPATGEAVRLRRRARLVALDLRELGVDDASIERHLLRRGVHPAAAFEAARWAWSPEGEADRPHVTNLV
jgi:hypothetical protein